VKELCGAGGSSVVKATQARICAGLFREIYESKQARVCTIAWSGFWHSGSGYLRLTAGLLLHSLHRRLALAFPPPPTSALTQPSTPVARDYIQHGDKHRYGVGGSVSISHDAYHRASSPLLRLPGKIRNQIYGYLIVNCNVRFSTHFLPRKDIFWHSRGFSYSPSHIALTQINYQIREEVCSYILDHGTFYVKFEHLSNFDRYLEDEKKNRICSVVIDVAYQKRSIFALGDAMTVTSYLGPLCKKGKLNHIVVSGFTGSHNFIYPNVLVEHVGYLLLFSIGEREVRVEEGAKRYLLDEEEEEEEGYGEEDEDKNE